MSSTTAVFRTALAVGFALASWQTAEATILVGTAAGVDDLTAVQTLINNYNAVNDPDLPAAEAMVDKFEEGGFVNGFLSLGDFTFYTLKDGIATDNSLAIADVFTADNLVEIPDGDFDLANDYKVLAFKYDGVGPAPFNYYVSKNGPDFTLWTLMDGFNPVYVEVSPADANFQPLNNGVSHISFYGPTGPTINEVPEPASAGLVGLGLLSTMYLARRRSRKAAAA